MMKAVHRTQPLAAYRRRRDFSRTPEPPGVSRRFRKHTRGRVFVVQKHQASRLHYDFRLEHAGLLLSWALPRGPSLDPSVKRLAMAVEDHPLDYATFEGVIPEGEYGGGTVMVWDRGTYVPAGPDLDRSLRKGELKFTLRGKKLKGSWVLVRTRSGAPRGRPGRHWLLIKHRDGAARPEDITLTRPRSVATNRLLADIARDEGGDAQRAAAGDPPQGPRAPRRRPAAPARSIARHRAA